MLAAKVMPGVAAQQKEVQAQSTLLKGTRNSFIVTISITYNT